VRIHIGKKIPKNGGDESSDEDAIARLFEKNKKSSADHEEDDVDIEEGGEEYDVDIEEGGEEYDVDIEEGGEEYDVDMEEDYEGYTEEYTDNYDDGSEGDWSENDEEMEEADFIGLEGV
jgi:hypothetical protein